MTTSSPELLPRAVAVEVTDEHLAVDLDDGRHLRVPLSWFPRLVEASPEQRRAWTLLGEGIGIRWPALDEDLSVEGLLRGTPARRSTP